MRIIAGADTLRGMVIVLMGVSGAGKTTVGRLLAGELGWQLLEGDDLHSAANKSKMARGIALSDADRAPWLASIRRLITGSLSRNVDAVVACSALKQAYRDEIALDPRVKIVYLRADQDLIAARIAARRGHFMSKDLLQSQFDTLEQPRDAIEVDVSGTPQSIVEEIRRKLQI